MIMKLQISRTFVSSSNHDDLTCGDLSGRGAGRAPCPRAWPARAPAPAQPPGTGRTPGPAAARTPWSACQLYHCVNNANIIINCSHYHDPLLYYHDLRCCKIAEMIKNSHILSYFYIHDIIYFVNNLLLSISK